MFFERNDVKQKRTDRQTDTTSLNEKNHDDHVLHSWKKIFYKIFFTQFNDFVRKIKASKERKVRQEKLLMDHLVKL